MGKLTTVLDWDYSSYSPPSLAHFQTVARDQKGWVGIARKYIPDGVEFLELGCAPGYCSAVLTYGKNIKPFGVDFSNSAGTYLTTMISVGHENATLIRQDILNYADGCQYDVVGSFGLIEHFSGDELEKVIALHRNLTKPGGTVIIEVPNFNGFQRFWHMFFDNPSYKKHNINVMNKKTFDAFSPLEYEVEYCEFVGHMALWGDSGAYAAGKRVRRFVYIFQEMLNRISNWLSQMGMPLTGKYFSPALLFIATKRIL